MIFFFNIYFDVFLNVLKILNEAFGEAYAYPPEVPGDVYHHLRSTTVKQGMNVFAQNM